MVFPLNYIVALVTPSGRLPQFPFAMLCVALDDEPQGAFPIVIAQACAQLSRRNLSLVRVSALSPPADPHAHLDELSIRCSRAHELLRSRSSDLALVFNHLEAAFR